MDEHLSGGKCILHFAAKLLQSFALLRKDMRGTCV